MKRFTPPGVLGFGGASLGNMYEAVGEQTAEETLVAAWDSGVRHFDTAPVYGRGLCELRFGHVLRRYPRESFVLSTKVGRLMRADRRAPEQMLGSTEREATLFKGVLPFAIEVDYGYDAAMRSIEDSYQRLGMAQIDVVYVHDLGADHLGDAWEEQFELAMNGCFRALATLPDQGVIKAWGLGNNVVDPCIRALERTDLDVIQLAGRYSLLDQSALDRLFPMCSARGVPVVLGGTYNSDLLAGGRHYDYRDAAPSWSPGATASPRSVNGMALTFVPSRCSSARLTRLWLRSFLARSHPPRFVRTPSSWRFRCRETSGMNSRQKVSFARTRRCPKGPF
jgi:D-threo-aldose 1-dehydrogenase